MGAGHGKESTNHLGVNNPNYKGKGWSNRLPERLINRLIEAREYKDLYTNREDIAFLRMRQSKLAERMEAGGDPMDDWFEFKKLNKEKDDLIFQLIETTGEDQKTLEQIKSKLKNVSGQINGLIISACEDVKVNKEMRSIIDQVSALNSKQTEIEVRTRQYVKVDEIALLFDALVTGINLYLPDENEMINSLEARRKLFSHLSYIFNLPVLNENGYRSRKPERLKEYEEFDSEFEDEPIDEMIE
jgi:hypothetical protein